MARLKGANKRLNEIPRDYTAVAWGAALIILRVGLRDHLRSRGLWPDFCQEVSLCAFIAERDRLTFIETCRFTQREIYRALREYGYIRPWKSSEYIRPEVTETEYIGDPTEHKSLFERVDELEHHREGGVIVVSDDWDGGGGE